MLETLKAYAATVFANAEARWTALVLAIFVIVYLLRKFAPSVWLAFEARSPFIVADPAPVLAALHKAYQAIPSVVLGAAIPALLSGGDVKSAVIGALLGLIPPLQHELAKWSPIPYRGELGKTKPKGPSGPGGGDAQPVGLADVPPRSARPPAGLDAELSAIPERESRAHGLLLAPALLLVVACSSLPQKLPCNEERLRAIDVRYIQRVSALCLAKYDKASDCPEFPALVADHRRELREECQ